MQAGIFSGWMTRHVFYEQAVSQDDLGNMREGKNCPTLVVPIESPVKQLVKMHFHTIASGRH